MTGGSRLWRRYRPLRVLGNEIRHVRRARSIASAFAAVGVVVAAACYSSGNGTSPPANSFYYPIAATVSAAGNVLYVVNSDFDLQYNSGTVQSYDLNAIRNDTVALLLGITATIPFEAGVAPSVGCPNTENLIDGAAPTNPNDPNGWNNQPGRLPIGQACAPPIDSRRYFQDWVTIGAFATDIRFSQNYKRLFIPVRGSASIVWIDVANDSDPDLVHPPASEPSPYQSSSNFKFPTYAPFQLSAADGGCDGSTCSPGCKADPVTHSCNPDHNAGQLSDYGNTRQVQTPGEPFAMAFTDDGMAIALTQQTENQTSLFLSGFVPNSSPSTSTGTGAPDAGGSSALDAGGGVSVDAGASDDASLSDASISDASGGGAVDASDQSDAGSDTDASWNFGNSASLGTNEFPTSIQFIVQDMPLGGDGIVSIPHDPAAIPSPDPANPLRPAFLQTSNQTAEIDLLRYYSDEGYQQNLNLPDGAPTLEDSGVAVKVGSTNLRPFLLKERVYGVSTSGNGSNSRGIAIDPTPRIACEYDVVHTQGKSISSPEYVACAQTPARVFIGSRSPPSLIIGQVGGMAGDGTTYDPDQFSLSGNVPLSIGPSNVYVAPIVNKSGKYEVRVFIVCFDSQTIAIYDPDAQRIENVVQTGPGPFGMAFDPFDINDVAVHAPVPFDPRSRYSTIVKGTAAGPALRKYRFAYITSFTDSFLQVMDLDQSFRDDRIGLTQSTYENIVYTLGVPTQPVGSN